MKYGSIFGDLPDPASITVGAILAKCWIEYGSRNSLSWRTKQVDDARELHGGFRKSPFFPDYSSLVNVLCMMPIVKEWALKGMDGSQTTYTVQVVISLVLQPYYARGGYGYYHLIDVLEALGIEDIVHFYGVIYQINQTLGTRLFIPPEQLQIIKELY
jgi:hypothetical protein